MQFTHPGVFLPSSDLNRPSARKRLFFSWPGNPIRQLFQFPGHILSGSHFVKGVKKMRYIDPRIDLDDLIFGEDDGGPSQR